MKKSTIAVIPARQGSKRIPGKNTREFCGRPIILYSIETAIQSRLFDEVVVSSDSEEILKLASNHGASVVKRPAELSGDHTPILPVVRHAIIDCEQKSIDSKWICCIYPTSVFLDNSELREGYRKISTGTWDFVFSIAPFMYPIQRALTYEGERICMVHPKFYSWRTQDLEVRYHDADKFYWGAREAWMTSERIFSAQSSAVVVESNDAWVIDQESDWEIAESLYKSSRKRNGITGKCE